MIYNKTPSSYDEYFIVIDQALLENGIGDFFDQITKWKTSNQNHQVQVFKSDSVSDKDFEKLKSCVEIMKKAEGYDDYKKAFDKFCYFCHIMSRGVILKKYDLKKGNKPDENNIYVEYSYNTKKIKLPEGTVLYHMSKVGGIKNLLPFFRGKSEKGFMYDKPRIYFTIRRHMPRFLADYKMNDKLYMYKCKENINYAYVDPLVWSNIQGAIYVETNKPIAVEEITKNDIEKEKEESPENKNESTKIDFEDFYKFVSENGLILDQDYNE